MSVPDQKTNAAIFGSSDFGWSIPEFFNIGVDVTDRWAVNDPERTAIIDCHDDSVRSVTFGELSLQSNRLANFFVTRGLRRGDRVGVLAPQRVETAIAHAAIFKAGGISVPLFSLFGRDALLHRLRDSGTRYLITDATGFAKMKEISEALPELVDILCMDLVPGAPSNWQNAMEMGTQFEPVVTRAEDPALIIYTSGTTGSSKGVLHAHRVLLGHLPGVEMSHGGLPKPGDCMWTPADWAWIGGLLDVLLPALHYGIPVVAKRFAKFDAEAALELMAERGVTCVFLPPTALRMLRQVREPKRRWKLVLRSIASGGESLGRELLTWGEKELGLSINEFYGQTECNMIVSSCSARFSARPGAIGKPAPGHNVCIVNDTGAVLPCGEEGNIAVHAPDPVMFLGYWNRPDATAEKFIDEWLITGDRGFADDEGFIHFVGRTDDVITSGGYRIGPGEIEDCLLKHPAVAAAGVVGVPDTLRTEHISAFIVLREGVAGSTTLAAEMQAHVRTNLGGHQYPRDVRFVTELPTTVTGKIIRGVLRQIIQQNVPAG